MSPIDIILTGIKINTEFKKNAIFLISDRTDALKWVEIRVKKNLVLKI